MSQPTSVRSFFPTALLLAGFWLLLSGHYSSLLLTLGLGSTLLVLWLLRRADRASGPHQALGFSGGLLHYLVWLSGQLVRANLAVAKRILDPRLPIQPGWERLEHDLESPLQATLYANSITLTPDTLTTHILPDGSLMVHSLWPQSITELRSGEMQQRIENTHI